MLYLAENQKNIILSGLAKGSVASLLIEIASTKKCPLLHIAIDDKTAANLANTIAFFAPDYNIIEFPAWDCLPYDRISPHMQYLSTRAKTLWQLTQNISPKTIILTTVNAVLQKVPPPNIIKEMSLTLARSKAFSREKLIDFLVRSGYSNAINVNEAGEFALRGSIIDIAPSCQGHGIRIDFFGDFVDSIRKFDLSTQISDENIDNITLKPASEISLSEESRNRFKQNYLKNFGVKSTNDPLYEAVTIGRKYSGMEHWLPLFYEEMTDFFTYLKKETIITFTHLCFEAIEERLDLINDYYHSRLTAKNEKSDTSYNPLPPDNLYINTENFTKITDNFSKIYFNHFKIPAAENVIDLSSDYRPSPNLLSNAKHFNQPILEYLQNELTRFFAENKKIALACFSNGSMQRIKNLLDQNKIKNLICDDFVQIVSSPLKTLCLITLPLEDGFIHNDLWLISEQELFGERITRARISRKKAEKFIQEVANLCEGELVVHAEHGLGRFEKLETLQVSGENHDCLKIIYLGGDILYVPVENIDILSRYGSDSEEIKLDKLGSSHWQARKAKMKKRIKFIAEELIKIAATRELKKSQEFISDQALYTEFCARFPYNETEDQLNSISQIEEDLSSGKPMDRLICGDVGFGKTEIAMRAAFLVASSEGHNQVAVISPTTLLCRQHYLNFKERFAGFALNIRDLSRLTLKKEAKLTKQGLKEGSVDIVIGTHSLLAKSIEFKKLGLVIIDEEQQFGVVQKERFKQLRANVNILSLSATPIPRTLQMALSGIKDLSIIATPPVDRLSIRSFTMPFDPIVVRNALLREFHRGGKSFFVVPKIKNLHESFDKLSKLVPEIKIIVAHGQMPPQELDQAMSDFYEGKYDLLISTNIIGSGLDLPSANTIIVHHADLFGLAQLYQMRGRVGRSKIRAYAYFTTNPKKMPTKQAMLRLEVMQSLDSLGAGFNIASHDMDIRGFGNLVGDEQSGHVREVGVELYQEMLHEAIMNLKQNNISGNDEETTEKLSPIINLGIPVLIPETYISDVQLRLGLYRRIALVEEEQEIEAIAIELIDRFGKFPNEVNNLLEIMKIKLLCKKIGIEKIDAGSKGLVIGFYKNTFKNPEALINFVYTNPLRSKIRSDQKLVLLQDNENTNLRIKETKASLENLLRMVA